MKIKIINFVAVLVGVMAVDAALCLPSWPTHWLSSSSTASNTALPKLSTPASTKSAASSDSDSSGSSGTSTFVPSRSASLSASSLSVLALFIAVCAAVVFGDLVLGGFVPGRFAVCLSFGIAASWSRELLLGFLLGRLLVGWSFGLLVGGVPPRLLFGLFGHFSGLVRLVVDLSFRVISILRIFGFRIFGFHVFGLRVNGIVHFSVVATTYASVMDVKGE